VAIDTIQITVLAIIQGLTEFLPVSSSGHLLLPSLLLDWPDQGLNFDVAVHMGSLSAIIFYFRRDLLRLLLAWCFSLLRRKGGDDARLAWLIILGTIPAGLAGLLLNDYVEAYARSLPVIATTSILFALLLYASERQGTQSSPITSLNWRTALLIGLAQVLALIPGTSRSGVTMTAGLFCNLTRAAAARFSFLLSIPIIFATGLLKTTELMGAESELAWAGLLYATLLSGVVAFCCIHVFLRLIDRIGFLPFVIYRIALGVALFGIYLV